MTLDSNQIDLVRGLVRDVADFPKPGILFKDITPILGDATGLAASIDLLADLTRDLNAEVIAAPESRGFIFGVPLATRLGIGMAPIRKKGKLPWKTIEESYALEYGEDTVQMHEDAVRSGQRVLLVDDLLATGGTMGACAKLVEKAGGEVVGCAFVIELAFLEGRKKLEGYDSRSLITY